MTRRRAAAASARERALPRGGGLAAALAAGMVVDGLVGDPARGHPVAAFGRLAGTLERRLWRPSRAAGALYAGTLVGAAAAGAALADLALRRRPLGRAGLLATLTWVAVGGRSLGETARELAAAVAADDLAAARRLAPALVGRDPRQLDRAELCRAAVESVAENTADAVVGPLVWGVLAGPAGVAAYRAANTLDAMVGHGSARYRRFGWAAARLDDVLTWPAARLGAVLAVALAPLAGGDAPRAARVLRRDGPAHPSPNAGRMEAAFAGALGVRLGGPNHYGDRVEHRPHLGAGPPPDPVAVVRATRLAALVGTATTVLAAAAALPGRRNPRAALAVLAAGAAGVIRHATAAGRQPRGGAAAQPGTSARATPTPARPMGGGGGG